MTLDEKLDEALRATFPASDAFWLAPEGESARQTAKESIIAKCSESSGRST
ncbi:MAG: hypothetical protein IT513_17550 [Burkholderiales bacterium]|nr:hypothetical protein [Burkholderiales bacterium]